MYINTVSKVFKNAISSVHWHFWHTTAAILCVVIGAWLTGCATPPARSRPVVEPPVLHEVSYPHRSYRVQPGDGLRSVASRYGLDYLQVADWNGLRPPYTLHIGQILRLYPQSLTSADDEPLINQRSHDGRLKVNIHADDVEIPEGPLPADHIANDWIWPTKGRVVQTFLNGNRTRQGIRIAGELGQDIVAAESGRVIFSGGGLPGYGQLIIIKNAKNYLSAYGFNSKLLVQEGRKVVKGERIAKMGLSPEGKPMLHFEIRRGDVVLNPMRLLPHR